MKRLVSLLCLCTFLTASGLALSACEEEDGPAERAGESVDEAVDDAERAVQDATD